VTSRLVWVHRRTRLVHFRPSCPSLSSAQAGAVTQQAFHVDDRRLRCGICWPKTVLPEPLFEDERRLPS